DSWTPVPDLARLVGGGGFAAVQVHQVRERGHGALPAVRLRRGDQSRRRHGLLAGRGRSLGSARPALRPHPVVQSHPAVPRALRPDPVMQSNPVSHSDSRSSPGPLTVLLVAAWLGLLTGFGEVALLGIRRYVLHRFFFVGQDIVVALPVADAVLFVVLAVVFLILRRIAPARIRLGHLVGLLTAVGCFAWFLHYGPLHRVAALLLAVGAGVQVARMWNRASSRPLTLVRSPIPILLGLGVLVAAVRVGTDWWQRRQAAVMTPRPGETPVNVLLIVLDTVRAWSM